MLFLFQHMHKQLLSSFEIWQKVYSVENLLVEVELKGFVCVTKSLMRFSVISHLFSYLFLFVIDYTFFNRKNIFIFFIEKSVIRVRERTIAIWEHWIYLLRGDLQKRVNAVTIIISVEITPTKPKQVTASPVKFKVSGVIISNQCLSSFEIL